MTSRYLPFWMQSHYRRELARDAMHGLWVAPSLSGLKQFGRLLWRLLRNSVPSGNIEKYEAIWKSLGSVAPSAILDIGSLDGADSVELSRMFPTATVHAFEPDPENFPLLQQTAKCCKRIIPHQIALSDKAGKATFFASGAADDPYYNRASGSILRRCRVQQTGGRS